MGNGVTGNSAAKISALKDLCWRSLSQFSFPKEELKKFVPWKCSQQTQQLKHGSSV